MTNSFSIGKTKHQSGQRRKKNMTSCCICRRALFMVLFAMAMLSCSILVGRASAEGAIDNGDQTCANSNDGTCSNENYEDETGSLHRYIDDRTGEEKTFDPKEQFKLDVVNLSEYRADVYYDDGRYGVNIAIVEADGGRAQLNTFQGHGFFVTRHGVRENLYPAEVDGEEDVPLKFKARKPNQVFVIPEDAAPLSGERAAKNRCVDRYEMCAGEAARGTCSAAPGWMIVHCCKSCDEELNASELLDFDKRCSRERLNMTEPAWKPGDLNKLFEKWVTDEEFKQYTPTVLSSPDAAFGGIDGPWIITFDTFLTDFESEQIWMGGKKAGFERSTDQGASNEFGEMEQIVSKTRTSNNAWCTDACEQMPGVRSATDKIERVTGIPQTNYESFQILQYHKNQFYRMHHDSSAGKDESPAGHRILTFFLYLSDVEEGGATRFSNLGLDVTPKKGKALIWPSVMNDNPEMWDRRMYHEARDVIRGEKRAANHWIHLYDYITPNQWGCTGSFS